MRQFDLTPNPSTRSRDHAPYFLILQSHYLQTIDSVVVAPVIRDARRQISEVDVTITVEAESLVVALGELFSIERKLLRPPIASARSFEDDIRRGLSRVFTGF